MPDNNAPAPAPKPAAPAKPDAPAKPAAPAKPDALKVPHALIKGGDVRTRIHDILDRFGVLLKVDRPVVRNQTEFYFIATDETQLLQGRFDGPMSGQSRYRWEPQESGVEYGYLVEGA